MNEKERLIKALNSYEYFENNKDKLIDLFVSYYGEEERTNIETKFKNAIFIAYQTPKSYLTKLHKLENIVSKELVAKTIEGNTLGLTIQKVIRDTSFEYPNIHPIMKYIKFYEQYSLGETGRKEKTAQDVLELAQKYSPNITKEEIVSFVEKKEYSPNLTSLPGWLLNQIPSYLDDKNLARDYQDVMNNGLQYIKDILPDLQFTSVNELMQRPEIKELNNIVARYQEAEKDYQTYKQKFHNQYAIAQHDETLEKKFKDYFDQEFIKQIRPLIPLEKQNNIDEYLKDSKKKYLLDKYVRDLMENRLNCFFSKANGILEDPQTSTWQKQTIITERISYFKSKGINLGNDYQEYVNRKDIWPSEEYIYQLEQATKKRESDFTFAYNSHTYYNELIIERLRQANLVSGINDFSEILKGHNSTCIMPAYSKENNTLTPLVFINFDHETDNLDHSINHELNHLYELSTISSTKDGYLARCGFDFIEEHYNQSESNTKRKYEYFNEVINEKIAQEISAKAHEVGYSLFAGRDEKYTNQTSYEKMNFIVNELFKKYKDIILASRQNNNFELLETELGKDNIASLNSLFEIFQKYFSGFEHYNYQVEKAEIDSQIKAKIAALQKGGEISAEELAAIINSVELTPKVKIHQEMEQKVNEIMSRIEEYRRTNSVKL